MTNEKNSSRKATKAPPPICPLDQQLIVSLRTSGLESSNPEPANWEYWKNVATVELGQALLLSINVEPLGGGLLIGNAPKTGWRITPGYLNATGKAEIFDERWHLIRNKLETAYAASGLPPTIDLHTFIRLPLFATIAVEFGWAPLPSELVDLIDTSSRSQRQPKESIKSDSQPEQGKPRVAWQAIMIESWERIRLANKGKRPSARQAMAWLKKNGPRDKIPEQQPFRDSLRWIDGDGEEQTAKIGSISSRISEWIAAKTVSG